MPQPARTRQVTAKPLFPPWLVIVIAVAAVAALVVSIVLAVTGGDEEADDDAGDGFRAYAAEVAGVFDELGQPLRVLAEQRDADALDTAQSAIPELRDRIESLTAPDGSAPAKRFYLATVDLYDQAVRAHGASLELEAEAAAEADKLADRIRAVADRAYDRAVAITAPSNVRREVVPDWREAGVAPGPSLSGAGDAFEADARARAGDGDEKANRRAVQLLVLSEAERARTLAVDQVALGLELVAQEMTG